MSAAGKAWLSWALDPFHDDVSLAIEGFPDNSGHATTIRTFNKYNTVTAPESAIEGEKWNMWVFTMPIQDQSLAEPAIRSVFGDIAWDSSFTGAQIGTINIWTWPQSAGTAFEALESGALRAIPIIGDETNAASDISLTRIIAGGFEVSNDTAELYKDGHVVSYSTPSLRSRDYATNFDSNSDPERQDTPLFVCRGHPVTTEEARAIKNAVSWKAADGCYTPFRIDVVNNHFEQASYIPYYFESSRVATETNNLFVGTDRTITAAYRGQVTKYAALDNVGSIFTGLNYETTMTVNSRIITETAPVNSIALLSYNPSYTPSDAMSIAMYREALSHLPPSVTYAENANASFWSKALNVVSKVATPIGMLLGQPAIGGAVAAASGAAAKALEKKIEAKVEKKITQKTKDLEKKVKNVEKKTNAAPTRKPRSRL